MPQLSYLTVNSYLVTCLTPLVFPLVSTLFRSTLGIIVTSIEFELIFNKQATYPLHLFKFPMGGPLCITASAGTDIGQDYKNNQSSFDIFLLMSFWTHKYSRLLVHTFVHWPIFFTAAHQLILWTFSFPMSCLKLSFNITHNRLVKHYLTNYLLGTERI